MPRVPRPSPIGCLTWRGNQDDMGVHRLTRYSGWRVPRTPLLCCRKFRPPRVLFRMHVCVVHDSREVKYPEGVPPPCYGVGGSRQLCLWPLEMTILWWLRGPRCGAALSVLTNRCMGVALIGAFVLLLGSGHNVSWSWCPVRELPSCVI